MDLALAPALVTGPLGQGTGGGSGDQVGGVAGWAVGLMESFGVFGAALVIAMENLFPPIPSEVILPIAGFAAGQGEFGLVSVLVATTVGSVAGAVLLYVLGRVLGEDRLRAVAARVPLLEPDDFDKADRWFERHGRKAVFFGRMVPVFRSVISVPAGVQRMPPAQFVGLTAAGSAIWNSVFVVAGFALGENWSRVKPYASAFQWLVLGATALALAVFVTRRVRAHRARRDA
jgi:membrane protein DedA with SNARE-associated domain